MLVKHKSVQEIYIDVLAFLEQTAWLQNAMSDN